MREREREKKERKREKNNNENIYIISLSYRELLEFLYNKYLICCCSLLKYIKNKNMYRVYILYIHIFIEGEFLMTCN